MGKQDNLLLMTLVCYQIIGRNGEARLFARANPSVIPDHWL